MSAETPAAPAAPVPGVRFDHSPGMVHDLPGEPDDPALKPAPAPAPAIDPALLQAREAELAELRKTADGMPLGQTTEVALQRACEAVGLDGAEAAAIVAQWLPTFEAHGIAARDVDDCITAGMGIAKSGPPDEATEARWLAQCADMLAREFGGAGPAARMADLARAYVARDKQLCTYLQETRLGSHPRVVLAIARAAHNARRAGKF